MDGFISELLWFIIKWLFIIAIIYTTLTYIFKQYSDFGMVNSRWQQSFDFHFSTQDFYTAVENKIKANNVSGISFSRKAYSIGSIISVGREYMRITYQEQMILVCASPFGTGSFVSWWSGEWMNFFKDLVPRIPRYGAALSAMLFSKTYYQMDTENMFTSIVKKAVLATIDELTNEKGVRPLSELERQPQYISNPYKNQNM